MRKIRYLIASSLVFLSACTATQSQSDLPLALREPAGVPGANLQHQALLNWVDRKEDTWLQARNQYEKDPSNKDFQWTNVHVFPKPLEQKNLVMPPNGSWENIRRTTDAYFEIFGRNSLKSFVWTGLETGNNLTMDLNYRWDSLHDAGLIAYESEGPQKIAAAKENRLKLVRALKESGVWNIRLGMPNHKVSRLADGTWDEAAWKAIDDLITDIAFPCGEANSSGTQCEGLRISLDMHHFGIESRFCVDAQGNRATYKAGKEELCDKTKYDPTRSFYMNESWPEYFAIFSLEAYKRFHSKIKAITLINEPDTTAQFNAGFWHGAFPGFTPDAPQYTVERAINIGKAAVLARLLIEKEILKNQHPRIVFIHSEAAQSKPDDPYFVRYSRFFTSDLILGHPWLLSSKVAAMGKRDPQLSGYAIDRSTGQPERPSRGVDFEALSKKWNQMSEAKFNANTSMDWAIQQVVFGNRTQWPQPNFTREDRYDRIVNKLNDLRELHLRLYKETRQTMMTYTILGIDYYMPNESYAAEIQANVAEAKMKERLDLERKRFPGKQGLAHIAALEKDLRARLPKVKRMRHEPQFYAEDVRLGARRGLFPVMVDYWNRYPLPVMIAETGTAYFHYLDLWCQQMLIDSATLARSGIPFLGLTLYPTVDNWGWDAGKAMARPRSESKIPMPSGIVWLHTSQAPPEGKLPGAKDWEVKDGFKNFIREIKSTFNEN